VNDTIQVHVPTPPATPPAQLALAARRPLEAPTRIGLVDNGKPRAKELLWMIAEEIGQRVPVGAVELLSKPSAANPISEEEAAELAGRVDLVVAGLGDCGACTACSVHDALLMEAAGVPSTVLVTEVFVPTVARFSDVLGAPGYHHLPVPHPVATKSSDHLRQLARGVVDAALAQVGVLEGAGVA
jgi:hypothetical protein